MLEPINLCGLCNKREPVALFFESFILRVIGENEWHTLVLACSGVTSLSHALRLDWSLNVGNQWMALDRNRQMGGR